MHDSHGRRDKNDAAAPPSPCLTADQAAAFAAGELTMEELSQVEEHIDACETCRRLLSNVAELARSRLTPLLSRSRLSVRADDETAQAFLAPGSAVGRYVVDRPLGAGAMGLVYLGHDPELDRKVALKVIRTGALPDPLSAEEL